MNNQHSYEDYVVMGKRILSSLRLHQVHIAYFATQVCQISHGGAIGRKLYTIQDYAKDIGMNRKTLSAWVSIYRSVITKVEIELNDVTIQDWTVATRVHALLKDEKKAINDAMGMVRAKEKGWKVNASHERIKSLFELCKKQRPVEAEVNSWTDSVIGIKNKIKRRDLNSVPLESLILLKKHLDGASENLVNYLMNDRGMSLGELV